ncbi:MAG: hypothetical protein JWO98_539, partial [Frankiales bacterium]|nr:hypothetical protein [Frankiales bacterium]
MPVPVHAPGTTAVSRPSENLVPKVLHWLLAAAALGFLAYQVPSLLRSGRQAAGELNAISWWWVAASVVLGLAAVAAYGELHRELLVVGGFHLPPAIV